MKTKRLYEAIIDFCRIMAIFILFAIVVNLLSGCESVEEQQCNYPESCFIIVKVVPDGDVMYRFLGEKLCTKERFWLRTRIDDPNYFVFDQVYCNDNVRR